jgi:hypothetical protein
MDEKPAFGARFLPQPSPPVDFSFLKKQKQVEKSN